METVAMTDEEDMDEVLEANNMDSMKNETAPLSAFEIDDNVGSASKETTPLISIKEENDSELMSKETAPLSEIKVADVWTSELVEKPQTVEQAYLPQPNETMPLNSAIVEAETGNQSLLEEIAVRSKERQKHETENESEEESRKKRALEKSRLLIERSRAGQKAKRMVIRSQDALDKASPDPSIRFAIITLVLFVLALLLFFFSRTLK